MEHNQINQSAVVTATAKKYVSEPELIKALFSDDAAPSRYTLGRWRKQRMPHLKIKGKIVYDRDAVSRWLERQSVSA
ncbi:MAG: hypothetical protein SFY80_00775 [Verrucomicrobiota bacterium]|nr:hypothetical protein [Verrucomicrobiota bacterium]